MADPGATPGPARVHLTDEFNALQRCIIFGPGNELERMVPIHIERALKQADGTFRANPDYLLFDDLVMAGALRDEHRVLRQVLHAAVGPGNLLDLRRLLQRILWPEAFRTRVIDSVLALEETLFGCHDPAARALLDEMPPSDLADALISGCVPGASERPDDARQVLRWPMPNWLFARDCFAVAGDTIVLGHPRHRARHRDGLLARAIVRYHPEFQGADVIDLEAEQGVPERFFEGGDLLLPAPGVALIGIGIRTNYAAASALAQALSARGFRDVLGVHLPLRRGAMHLDTIFTMLDAGTCLHFAEAFAPSSPTEDRVEVVDLLAGDRALGCALLDVLASRGITLQSVNCGDGDKLAARREQWTDGANALCLGPGRALLYARNTRTLDALNRAGFEILLPAEFCRNAALLMSGDRRFVVALSGFELSRGRGGPRCLTLPLRRAS